MLKQLNYRNIIGFLLIIITIYYLYIFLFGLLSFINSCYILSCSELGFGAVAGIFGLFLYATFFIIELFVLIGHFKGVFEKFGIKFFPILAVLIGYLIALRVFIGWQ